jgi:hypothetical protein
MNGVVRPNLRNRFIGVSEGARNLADSARTRAGADVEGSRALSRNGGPKGKDVRVMIS